MNSGRRDRLVSRWMDGDLAPDRASEVEADLARSEEARRVRAEFAEVGERLRGLPVPSGPAPEAAWADVRRALRLEGDGADRRRAFEILVSRPVWAGGMMGVLGLGIIVGIWMWQGGGGPARASERSGSPGRVHRG